jgi:hypothetical protein
MITAGGRRLFAPAPASGHDAQSKSELGRRTSTNLAITVLCSLRFAGDEYRGAATGEITPSADAALIAPKWLSSSIIIWSQVPPRPGSLGLWDRAPST